jgi:23S rRNA (uracil1939-C5)-methyltransferase
MRKTKKKPVILEGLEVEKLAAEGMAIARHEGRVIFIPFAAPGDVVTVRLGRRKEKWAEATLIEITEYSADRIQPRCKHFGECGGCKWQHIPYKNQLAVKQQQVIDQFERLGGFEMPEVMPVLPASPEWEYRNKVEFSFSDSRWLNQQDLNDLNNAPFPDACGFHAPGRYDKVLEINHCYLTDQWTNQARNQIAEMARKAGLHFYNPKKSKGDIRNILFRHSNLGERMLLMVYGPDISDEQMAKMNEDIALKFPEVNVLLTCRNNKLNDSLDGLELMPVKGTATSIMAEMDGLYFSISAPSFFQTNSHQALELYRKAYEMAGLTGNEIVYDLYTGTGTIACFMAGNAQKVVGIEYVEDAVSDARRNAERNNLTNLSFYAGDMKSVFSNNLFEAEGMPDVIIADPPRSGMHPDVVAKIKEVAPNRFVYISCNPATQARDIALLADTYRVETIQPVDMFPHTHHVENIALLIKK